ncbi:hypothetical protein GDO81_000249 [Engystomops pustulosus]|uniref:Secreted protein n=1 Tax=Engystomops pustulosus TaxID=76066 RepID=A0AAV7D4S0_ENGPU|nr:hypothetical protein GDO81_000249 [Engystomops pustulosus]
MNFNVFLLYMCFFFFFVRPVQLSSELLKQRKYRLIISPFHRVKVFRNLRGTVSIVREWSIHARLTMPGKTLMLLRFSRISYF